MVYILNKKKKKHVKFYLIITLTCLLINFALVSENAVFEVLMNEELCKQLCLRWGNKSVLCSMFVLMWAVFTELSWPKMLKAPSKYILIPLIFNFNLAKFHLEILRQPAGIYWTDYIN